MGNEEPRYMQIYNELKKDFYNQTFKVGELIPTEDELVERFQASKTTIRHSIAMLIAEHFINVKQGRGMTVLPIPNKQITYNKLQGALVTSMGFTGELEGKKVESSVLSIERTRPIEEIQNRLQLPAGEDIFQIQYFHMIGEVTVAFYTDYLPCCTVPDLDRHVNEIIRVVPFVEKNYHVNIVSTYDEITFKKANVVESKILSAELDTPLLNMKRLFYSDDNHIFMYSDSLHRADFVKIKLENYNPKFIL